MTKKEPFTACGYYAASVYFGYLLQINQAGDSARVAIVNTGTNYTQVFPWAKIRYTEKGRSYIMHKGRRLHLDNFQWVDQ